MNVNISNDSSNRFPNRVQVAPLSSNTSRLYPNETRVRIRETESKAMADQPTTADKSRLIEQLGPCRWRICVPSRMSFGSSLRSEKG